MPRKKKADAAAEVTVAEMVEETTEAVEAPVVYDERSIERVKAQIAEREAK